MCAGGGEGGRFRWPPGHLKKKGGARVAEGGATHSEGKEGN